LGGVEEGAWAFLSAVPSVLRGKAEFPALEKPAASAEELAPLQFQAGELLAELIEGDADSTPDEPPE